MTACRRSWPTSSAVFGVSEDPVKPVGRPAAGIGITWEQLRADE